MSDLAREAVVLGEKPWWQEFYGVTVCERCGRSEGLSLGIEAGPYRVIKCDCNYAHIKPAERMVARPTLIVLP